jgi:hypothetical protein
MTSDGGDVTQLLQAMTSGESRGRGPSVAARLPRTASPGSGLHAKGAAGPRAATYSADQRSLPAPGGKEVDWHNREHFIGVAANVMRRVWSTMQERTRLRCGEAD